MVKKRLIPLSLVVLNIITTLLFFSLITALIIVFYMRKRNNNEQAYPQSYRYQSLEYDIHTNETSLGVIKIFEELSPDEYSMTRDDDGSITLVSHFGSEEFRCSGSCYCMGQENNENRRNILSTTVIKPLTLFVAAISSTMAYHFARSAFEEECDRELSRACGAKITSKVDECKGVTYESEIEDEKGMRELRYLCSGHCVDRVSVEEFVEDLEGDRESFTAMLDDDRYDHPMLLLREKLYYCLKMELIDQYVKIRVDKELESYKSNWMAKSKFNKKLLKPFCCENSVATQEELLKLLGEEDLKKYSENQRDQDWKDGVFTYCCSTNRWYADLFHIDCRKVN